MDIELEIKLIDCLDALASGEAIGTILARYPEDAEQLRPLLETAQVLPALRVEPGPAAQIESRRAFLNEAHRLRHPRARWFAWPSRLAAAAAALMLALVLGGGIVVASGSALPGDALYPVKRGAEQVRLRLSPDGARLEQEYAQRRRDEVEALLSRQRSAEVVFTGTIDEVEQGELHVAGIPVKIGAGTALDGAPQVGRSAEVRGRTDGGAVVASSVVVERGGAPLAPVVAPTSTPRPTATARPTATRTPQPTATTAPTITPRPSPSPEPSATSRPAPTAATRPVPPTAAPAPPDDNGNGNENGNENGDDGGGNENGDDGGGNENGDDGGGNENGDDSGGNENGDDSGGNENGDDGGGNENEDDSGGNDNEDDSGGNENGDDGGGNENGDDSGGNDNEDDSGGNDNEDDSGGGGNDDDKRDE